MLERREVTFPLTRNEFIFRLMRRARERYGQRLDNSWFDDLVKDGLLFEGKRNGNEGLRPIYLYNHQSYRRALQVVRFRRDDIVDRKALRIQLFLRGYSLPVWDVPEALFAEYIRHGRNNQVRSRYANNWKAIGPKHEESFASQLGPLDDRFSASGFQLSDDIYISAFRAAKQCPINDSFPTLSKHDLLDFCGGKIRFQALAEKLVPSIASGMLMFSADDNESPTDIEHLIKSSDFAAYEKARSVYRLIVNIGIPTFCAVFGSEDSPTSQETVNTTSKLIKGDPKWSTLILVLSLHLVRNAPALTEMVLSGAVCCDNVLELLRFFNESSHLRGHT